MLILRLVANEVFDEHSKVQKGKHWSNATPLIVQQSLNNSSSSGSSGTCSRSDKNDLQILHSLILMTAFSKVTSLALRQFRQGSSSSSTSTIQSKTSLEMNVMNPVRMYVSESIASLFDLVEQVKRTWCQEIKYSRLVQTLSGQELIEEGKHYHVQMLMTNDCALFLPQTQTNNGGGSGSITLGPTAEEKVAALLHACNGSGGVGSKGKRAQGVSCWMDASCLDAAQSGHGLQKNIPSYWKVLQKVNE